jgi:hypothetical protein
MIKLLEEAITEVRELPDEDEAVAAVMLAMAGVERPVVSLDDATWAAVREGPHKPSMANSFPMK